MPIKADRTRLGLRGEAPLPLCLQSFIARNLVSPSRIAARVRRIKPSPSTSAADRANELRRQGKSIVNLVVGEPDRSEEHTSELQSQSNLVCRLLLEKKKKTKRHPPSYICIHA